MKSERGVETVSRISGVFFYMSKYIKNTSEEALFQFDYPVYAKEGQFYLKNGRIEPFGSLSRLKQNVNSRTRSDHRAIMDAMIRLYSDFRSTQEKQSMGFRMSAWDNKLLKYGRRFEQEMMDLSVNIPLERALDLGWEILADCFEPAEVSIKTDLIAEYWPKKS